LARLAHRQFPDSVGRDPRPRLQGS
jgi:hypothetical protein